MAPAVSIATEMTQHKQCRNPALIKTIVPLFAGNRQAAENQAGPSG
jgi:hypothetical protein